MSQYQLLGDSVADAKVASVVTLPIRIRIVGNATAASKTLSSDYPSAVVIRANGQTATADAVESSVGFTTPVDATNARFGVLIKKSEIMAFSGDSILTGISLVKGQDLVGATATTSMTFAYVNTGTTIQGVTAAGNIALEVSTAASGVDLSAANTIDFYLVLQLIRRR